MRDWCGDAQVIPAGGLIDLTTLHYEYIEVTIMFTDNHAQQRHIAEAFALQIRAVPQA